MPYAFVVGAIGFAALVVIWARKSILSWIALGVGVLNGASSSFGSSIILGFWIILVGLVAGFIGGKIVDRHGKGFWIDIALGIVGALVGGSLFDQFGASGLNIYSMIVAIGGAIAALLIYEGGRKRRHL